MICTTILCQSKHYYYYFFFTCSMTSGAIQHGVPTNVFLTLFRVTSPPVARNALTPKSERPLSLSQNNGMKNIFCCSLKLYTEFKQRFLCLVMILICLVLLLCTHLLYVHFSININSFLYCWFPFYFLNWPFHSKMEDPVWNISFYYFLSFIQNLLGYKSKVFLLSHYSPSWMDSSPRKWKHNHPDYQSNNLRVILRFSLSSSQRIST